MKPEQDAGCSEIPIRNGGEFVFELGNLSHLFGALFRYSIVPHSWRQLLFPSRLRTDLTGKHTEWWRIWDSCFIVGFTYLAGGGAVRQSGWSRYRRWMTHVLATWWDQFDSTGYVSCGRCIAGCAVGIDITEEVRAIRDLNPFNNPEVSHECQ